MVAPKPNSIIEADWLVDHMNDPDVIVLDASYPPVGGKQSPYEKQQIKGSRFFEIDYFSDQTNPLPHMLAPAEEFQKKAQALGLKQSDHLVVYDNLGIYSSPRAWWMFKAMGHEKVSVLNGGLPDWVEKGHSVEDKEKREYPQGDFVTKFQPELVKSMAEMERNLSAQGFLVIDARSKGRFDGTTPEPRPELSNGHMPGSINVPFQDVLENGRFKSVEELEEVFRQVEVNKPLTFSCGSGLTACIILMAADQVLDNNKAVYDGSWTEWAGKKGKILTSK